MTLHRNSAAFKMLNQYLPEFGIQRDYALANYDVSNALLEWPL